MSWTRLPNVPRDDSLPAAISKPADKLDQSFTAISERRAEFDQQQKDVREQPVEKIDIFGIADRLRQVRHELLRDELQARRALDDYICEFRKWSQEAATAAFEELEKSQKAIRKKLIRVGFIDCLPTELVAGKIQPGMVQQHPSVIAGRQRHEQLRSRSLDIFARQENRRHIADLERWLSSVVEAAFA
jgi:hypothetical protein